MLGEKSPYAAEGASSILTGGISPFERPGLSKARGALMDTGRGATRPKLNLEDVSQAATGVDNLRQAPIAQGHAIVFVPGRAPHQGDLRAVERVALVWKEGAGRLGPHSL